MKERPILFSAPMVRALLDGTKTQTRRIVKFPHSNPLGEWEPTTIGGPGCYSDKALTIPLAERAAIWHTRTGDCFTCRHGTIGDRLWVKETWQYADWTEDGYPTVGYRADDARVLCEKVPEDWSDRLLDVWESLSADENYAIDDRAADRRWRPSIHMPRWASRILLEVTDVRVERLQAITEADAIAEGIPAAWGDRPIRSMEKSLLYGGPLQSAVLSAVETYASLWNHINGAGAWDANPFVWIMSFKRIEANA